MFLYLIIWMIFQQICHRIFAMSFSLCLQEYRRLKRWTMLLLIVLQAECTFWLGSSLNRKSIGLIFVSQPTHSSCFCTRIRWHESKGLDIYDWRSVASYRWVNVSTGKYLCLNQALNKLFGVVLGSCILSTHFSQTRWLISLEIRSVIGRPIQLISHSKKLLIETNKCCSWNYVSHWQFLHLTNNIWFAFNSFKRNAKINHERQDTTGERVALLCLRCTNHVSLYATPRCLLFALII